jgi:WXXGXW repeat (2 copies)
MKTRLLAILLLAGTSMFAGTHISVGFGIGGGYYAPPPPPPVYYAPPPAPGPGFTWVGGYYYPVGPRYYWHAGYWARPPYAHARWVGPRYYGHRYYRGYWRR